MDHVTPKEKSNPPWACPAAAVDDQTQTWLDFGDHSPQSNGSLSNGSLSNGSSSNGLIKTA
jgi:hypothetical protein